ncbi:hypothetical protein BDN70DRAFT_891782 [Pholiota conissans]|uniref:Uncharacterized protein n=1 Tax=Pholiota conissans TaxID=109636 RepID=A0A9P5ZBC6_9AGAR|nr:hypothetical protein BDN70DRAFT_891782 [Pholiota conissans]
MFDAELLCGEVNLPAPSAVVKRNGYEALTQLSASLLCEAIRQAQIQPIIPLQFNSHYSTLPRLCLDSRQSLYECEAYTKIMLHLLGPLAGLEGRHNNSKPIRRTKATNDDGSRFLTPHSCAVCQTSSNATTFSGDVNLVLKLSKTSKESGDLFMTALQASDGVFVFRGHDKQQRSRK